MAVYEDLSIDQGSDVAIELHLTLDNGSKKDLTGFSAAAKMKKSYTSSDSDAVSFTATFPGSRTDGVLVLSLTNTESDALKRGKYLYDVEISYVDSDANTIVERVLEGRVTVNQSITRLQP